MALPISCDLDKMEKLSSMTEKRESVVNSILRDPVKFSMMEKYLVDAARCFDLGKNIKGLGVVRIINLWTLLENTLKNGNGKEK